MKKNKRVLAAIAGALMLGSLAVEASDRKCNELTGLCEIVPFSNNCRQWTITVWENGEPYELDVCEDY